MEGRPQTILDMFLEPFGAFFRILGRQAASSEPLALPLQYFPFQKQL